MYISSDSEDELYGNMAQKLQKLMNKTRRPESPIEIKLVNKPDEIIDLCNVPTPQALKVSNSDTIVVPDVVYDTNRPLNALNSDEVILVPDVDRNYDSTSLFLSDPVTVPGVSKRKNSGSPRRGAKRGRGRGRGRGRKATAETPILPIEPIAIAGNEADISLLNDSPFKAPDSPLTAQPRRGRSSGAQPISRGRGRGRGRKATAETPILPIEPIAIAGNEADISLLNDSPFKAPDSPLTAQPRRRRSSGAQPISLPEPVQTSRKRANNQPPTPRCRGRGRRVASSPARPGRGRRRVHTPVRSNIPIYSIGNTDDYYDASVNQPIFKSPPQESVVIDLNDSIYNEVLSVKVEWQSVEVHKFNIRKLQKLTQIFDFFAQQEGVRHDQVLFTYNNKILSSDDTPESIDYNIAKFIEGGIVNSTIPQKERVETKQKGFKLKFQCLKLKKPFEVFIDNTDSLGLALIKCAEHLELPISSLRFEFDGETVKANMTPKEMDMESGDCIDVKIVNVNK